MIVTNQIDEFDSSESYFKILYKSNNLILIAFFNLGVSEHEKLNPTKKMKYISKSYFVANGINFLSINNIIVKNTSTIQNIELPSIYLGGENLDKFSKIIELEIKATKVFFQLLNDSKIYYSYPIPLLKKNDFDLLYNDFLELKNIPKNIKELLKNDIDNYSL